MSKQSSNVKHFTSLTAFSLSEKIIAFVYQAVLAGVLGAGVVTDCFFSASQLFDLIDSTVLGALVVVVINRFANISAEQDEQAGFRFLSTLNSVLSIVMAAVAVLTFILAKPFSYLIAPGFDSEARPELINCIRILCVIPPIMVFATMCQGLLRQKKCFIVVNSRSLFISFCGMAAVLLISLRHPNNSRILCYGYVAANLLFSIALFIRSRRFGAIRYVRPKLDDDVKKLFVMAVPAIISKGIVRISLMIDQVISSTLGKGAVSYLNYAHSLYNIVNSLLVVNLCIIMLTDFTNLCVRKDYERMKQKLSSAVSSILLLLGPVAVLTLIYSRQIVSIAYERGAFTAESSEAVGTLLFFYAIGFVPSMLNSLHTQVLHAFGKMNIAMRNSLISFGLNIVLSIVLSRFIGIAGIALGTSVSVTAVVFMYKKSVEKQLPNYKAIVPMQYVWKLLSGLAVCSAIAFGMKLLIRPALLSFAVATVCGFGGFALTLILLREQTLLQYFNALKNGLLRRGK